MTRAAALAAAARSAAGWSSAPCAVRLRRRLATSGDMGRRMKCARACELRSPRAPPAAQKHALCLPHTCASPKDTGETGEREGFSRPRAGHAAPPPGSLLLAAVRIAGQFPDCWLALRSCNELHARTAHPLRTPKPSLAMAPGSTTADAASQKLTDLNAVTDISDSAAPRDEEVTTLKAQREMVEAAIAAARQSYGQPEGDEETAMAAKRAEVAAAVAVALAQRKAGKAPAQPEASRQRESKKVTAKDLFGFDAKPEEKQSLAPDVKEYRMQGNYGATKFIKP